MRVPAGASLDTDPVKFHVGKSTDIAVSFYTTEDMPAPAIHYVGLSDFLSSGRESDVGFRACWRHDDCMEDRDNGSRCRGPDNRLCDRCNWFINDGPRSLITRQKPPLDRRSFRRLQAERGDAAPSVANLGISGNRVLHDAPDPPYRQAAVARYSRDVLGLEGVRYVVAFEGGNDIRMQCSPGVPPSETITTEQLIAAFKNMASQARRHNMKFIVGTITPFANAAPGRADDPRWEQIRTAFNDWARSSKDIDGVIDFDVAVRNPVKPAKAGHAIR